MNWQDIDGWFDFENVYDRLVETAPRMGTIVEVGCWMGRSTAYLGEKAAAANKALRVYAVDHFLGNPESEHMEFMRDHGGSIGLMRTFYRNMSVCGVLGDPVLPLPVSSVEAARIFRNYSLHAVFIDGAHTPEAVADDIYAWWPRIVPGGILAGHDYVNEVRETVDTVGASLWGQRDNTCPFNTYCWWVEKPR